MSCPCGLGWFRLVMFMAVGAHGAAQGCLGRSHFHRRHPDPGQGRRQRRELGACGDERVVFCGEADLFFLYGIFFLCVCVPIYLYEYIYVYDIYEYCAYMYITYIYRYVLPSTLKFFFFQGLGFRFRV